MKLLICGLLAGALDALAAIIEYLAHGNRHPGRIFQYIASAALGPDAMSGGSGTLLLGVLFHFAIAFCFVAAFFYVARRYRRITAHPVAAAIGYGVFVWCVMNLVVLPLTKLPPRHFVASNILIAMVILMIAIGLPAVYGARWKYRHRWTH